MPKVYHNLVIAVAGHRRKSGRRDGILRSENDMMIQKRFDGIRNGSSNRAEKHQLVDQ